MNYNKKSRYSYEDRKHIAALIENLKDKEAYRAIFKILTNDEGITYIQKEKTGQVEVVMNLTPVSDDTLDQVSKYLRKVNKKRTNQIEVDIDIVPGGNTTHNKTYKLSNYEKNILKQRNLKKILNNDNDYEELKFSKKASKPENKKTTKKTTKKVIAEKNFE